MIRSILIPPHNCTTYDREWGAFIGTYVYYEQLLTTPGRPVLLCSLPKRSCWLEERMSVLPAGAELNGAGRADGIKAGWSCPIHASIHTPKAARRVLSVFRRDSWWKDCFLTEQVNRTIFFISRVLDIQYLQHNRKIRNNLVAPTKID